MFFFNGALHPRYSGLITLITLITLINLCNIICSEEGSIHAIADYAEELHNELNKATQSKLTLQETLASTGQQYQDQIDELKAVELKLRHECVEKDSQLAQLTRDLEAMQSQTDIALAKHGQRTTRITHP